ncbi:restriction endonuclease subunit S [Streptomyces sp. NPDC048306]|uniref:restriction endonuclease subunit S n=1 Tax=Streptomyces sp. NPDC048306 TaxID=3154502 RepID=UPI0033ECE8B2
MAEWQRRKLGELCTRITVGHVGSMASRYTGIGIPFLRSLNIRRGRLELSALKYIDEGFHAELGKSALKPGDLAIVRTGEPGTTAVIPDDFGPANCSDLVIATPGPEVDARYLCYAINETAQDFVKAHTVGAVQQHFNVKSAKELVLSVPPLPVQRALSALLGALDDKIAVNERIADTSEELALNLASPVRWQARARVEEVCVLRREQVSPRDVSEELVDHYSLPAFDAGRTPEHVAPEAIKSGKFSVTEPAVLLSKLNPETPRAWDVTPNSSVPSLASTEFLVLVPRGTLTSHELWAVVRQQAFFDDLASRVTGTSKSHQRVRPAEVMATEIVDPRQFGEAGGQIRNLCATAALARLESQTLAALRDTLLPQLMSGRLRVKDAEKIVEDAT